MHPPVLGYRGPILALAGLLIATPVAAQSTDIVKAQLGEWLVATDDGRPGCRVRLKAEKTIGGMAATPAPDCASRLPALANVAAWHMSNGVKLLDATRKPILIFTEDETAILKTREGDPPAHYMIRPKAGIDRLPHASAVFGTWHMRRPKGPVICTITFRDRPRREGEESYGLSLDPACDPIIRRLKLTSWRIEDISLMLYGETDGLQFQLTSTGFEKVGPQGQRPLELVRQQ